MAKKLIITVRVNEYMPRDVNKHVPFTPDEIAETAAQCREAGASIIHFHARNSDGSPSHAPALYAEIVGKIRDRTGILVDSTLGQITVKADENRLAHIRLMGRQSKPRPDFAAVDTGSSNIDAYDPVAKRFKTLDKVYLNSTETCLFLAKGMTGGREAALVSVGCALRAHGGCIHGYGRRQRTGRCAMRARRGGGIVGAHPCTNRGLEALIDFMPPQRRIEWTVACKAGNLFNVASLALERGGHVAAGTGDYPYAEIGGPTNAELVHRFAELGRAVGREPATTDEARAMLGIGKH